MMGQIAIVVEPAHQHILIPARTEAPVVGAMYTLHEVGVAIGKKVGGHVDAAICGNPGLVSKHSKVLHVYMDVHGPAHIAGHSAEGGSAVVRSP